MNGRTPPPGLPDPTLPDRAHPRVRYRGAFRISLGISAVLHVLAISLYPSFFSGIPEAARAFGGYLQPLIPQGTELVNLREMPANQERETPPAPEDRLEPELPVIPVEAFPSDVLTPSGLVRPPEGPTGPTAAERIRPKAGDLRFWAPVNPERTALTREELMRLQLIGELELMNDSAALAAALAARATDWTYTDDEGKKWGVSPGKIHLGDLTLPMPFGFGPSAQQRERAEDRLWAWDAIERGAATGELLRSWKDRDKAIRERMNAQRKPDTTRTGGGGPSPPS
ncbi:MAG: hypothetical protein MUO50_16235 [Longimicrobiales bacterium]|nr:hypothetical protein [Longimicrobiales bacterium]